MSNISAQEIDDGVNVVTALAEEVNETSDVLTLKPAMPNISAQEIDDGVNVVTALAEEVNETVYIKDITDGKVFIGFLESMTMNCKSIFENSESHQKTRIQEVLKTLHATLNSEDEELVSIGVCKDTEEHL